MKINKCLLLCGFAVSYLFANADEVPFEVIKCSSNDKKIGVIWTINWKPDKNRDLQAKVTAWDGVGKPLEVMATNIVMEKVQNTDKFRVTRVMKATSKNHLLKPLNIKANDNKHKYVSVTYIKPTDIENHEIWMFNGYINKDLYENIELSCYVPVTKLIQADSSNGSDEKKKDSDKREYELEKLSVSIEDWFKKNKGFISNHHNYFKLVWIAPTQKFFNEHNENQFAFQGSAIISEYSDGSYTKKETKYTAIPAQVFNVDFYNGDGNKYYYGSYMDESRAKNGVPPSSATTKLTSASSDVRGGDVPLQDLTIHTKSSEPTDNN
ncbi:MAG: hypothetical protein K0R94_371 [Burkholderiales bacterium]|nr:hypothetical protein [Burkholderiales bacterium]